MSSKHTPGPWEYIPSTEHHGPYVTASYGGDICDCYAMSDPSKPAVCNGGTSRPIPHMGEAADANARLIAAAPDLLEALEEITGTFVQLLEGGDCCAWSPEDTEKDATISAARAAIAKAKGEQS